MVKKVEYREDEVCRGLARWLKEEHPGSVVYLKVTRWQRRNPIEATFNLKTSPVVDKRYFAPDIDVLMILDNRCYAYEVKVGEPKKEDAEGVHRAVYEGVGQALVNWMRVRYSYLVVPEWHVDDGRQIIERCGLPVGLVSYDLKGGAPTNFKYVKESEENREPSLEYRLLKCEKRKLRRVGRAKLGRTQGRGRPINMRVMQYGELIYEKVV